MKLPGWRKPSPACAERNLQDVSLLDDAQQTLKYIPCTGHSRIWLLQMEDVAFVSSRMSGIYVTDREGKEGFTELTLRTLESRTPLLRCHRQYLVNMAHLKEIRPRRRMVRRSC